MFRSTLAFFTIAAVFSAAGAHASRQCAIHLLPRFVEEEECQGQSLLLRSLSEADFDKAICGALPGFVVGSVWGPISFGSQKGAIWTLSGGRYCEWETDAARGNN